MSGRLRRCPRDGRYTLSRICPICGTESVNVHPARYAPQDPMGRYRRMMRVWTT